MRRCQELPELLSPAGDFSALIAAVCAGADAVYVGGERFGARAFAKNFTPDELRAAVKYCHLHGVRLYVTLNTLIYDKELDGALAYAKELYDMGVDALIVADLGVVSLIRQKLPDLELHASTQMGVHNALGADFAASLGISRVVLARECSRDDMWEIIKSCTPECEVFVHGALCVCHSGQCLFSSLVGGRSGNRGECAQPCRLPFNDNYPLSLRDLSLSEHIKELIDMGVASLKIEGRMKSADYVYRVTSIYRRLLDEQRGSTEKESLALARIFSRGGFTDGYFRRALAGGMTGVRTDEDKKLTAAASGAEFSESKLKITARAEFALGKPARLTLTAKIGSRQEGEREFAEIIAAAEGAVPTVSQNSPLLADAVRARLAKMGNTPFSLAPEDVELELEDGINLPPSAINALRRDCSANLEARFAKPLSALLGIKSAVEEIKNTDGKEIKREEIKLNNTALFLSEELLRKVAEQKSLPITYDATFVPLFAYPSLIGCESSEFGELGVYLPPVISESEMGEVREALATARAKGARIALIGNVSHITLCREAGISPVADFRMNITNEKTKKLLAGEGVRAFILSPELTLPMARDIGGGEIVAGRIPLMLTERCFIKENFGCDGCGKTALCDRRGARFPLIREYKHRNLILNSAPTYMGDKQAELKSAGITHAHFIFSTETAKECLSLMNSYKKGEPLPFAVRRIGSRRS